MAQVLTYNNDVLSYVSFLPYVEASGGEITYIGVDKIHTFKNVGSGIFDFKIRSLSTFDVSILIVGGGGYSGDASAQYKPGGGGGGGEVIEMNKSLSNGIYSLYVGDASQNSIFDSSIAHAGHKGKDVSGGFSGSGLKGGNGTVSVFSWLSGGGGGDSSEGKNAEVLHAGNGGRGTYSSISGINKGYGGGGGGSTHTNTAEKGLGYEGGGNGGIYGFLSPTNASVNSGGGAGGSLYGYGLGSYPGTGVVIIRYNNSYIYENPNQDIVALY